MIREGMFVKLVKDLEVRCGLIASTHLKQQESANGYVVFPKGLLFEVKDVDFYGDIVVESYLGEGGFEAEEVNEYFDVATEEEIEAYKEFVASLDEE